jgi:hypothetical protein
MLHLPTLAVRLAALMEKERTPARPAGGGSVARLGAGATAEVVARTSPMMWLSLMRAPCLVRSPPWIAGCPRRPPPPSWPLELLLAPVLGLTYALLLVVGQVGAT